MMGHLSARDSMKGALKEGFFTGEPKMLRLLRDMQSDLSTDISLHTGPVGEPGGGSFAGTFDRKEKYISVLFLDPKAIKILSLGAI